MNRKERRLTSKRLGIMQYQQKLPRNKKFELMRENIITGKQQHEQFIEDVRIQQQRTDEEIESDAIEFMARQIAANKKIALIDAMEEAQKNYNKHTKK